MIDKQGEVWSCMVCGKQAADPKTKVVQNHSNPWLVTFAQANLKRHTETHIKGIPWPCNICGKVSGSKSGLAQHRTKYHKDQEGLMEPKAPVQTAIPDECVINSMIEKHGEVGLSLLPVANSISFIHLFLSLYKNSSPSSCFRSGCASSVEKPLMMPGPKLT